MTAITKKGATHPRSFENTSAMVLLLCAPAPAAPAHSALLHGNLIAPDLAPSLPTPRAHWRQLHIKGRGLFHAYDVQIMKATLRSCQRFGTLSVGNLIAPDLAPSLTTSRAHLWSVLRDFPAVLMAMYVSNDGSFAAGHVDRVYRRRRTLQGRPQRYISQDPEWPKSGDPPPRNSP